MELSGVILLSSPILLANKSSTTVSPKALPSPAITPQSTLQRACGSTTSFVVFHRSAPRDSLASR